MKQRFVSQEILPWDQRRSFTCVSLCPYTRTVESALLNRFLKSQTGEGEHKEVACKLDRAEPWKLGSPVSSRSSRPVSLARACVQSSEISGQCLMANLCRLVSSERCSRPCPVIKGHPCASNCWVRVGCLPSAFQSSCPQAQPPKARGVEVYIAGMCNCCTLG